MIRHFLNIILYYLPPTRLFKFRVILLRLAEINIAKNSAFCGRSWIYGRGKLIIKSNTWISPGAVIHTHISADIVIGERCDIGPSVEFITGSHVIGGGLRRAGAGTAKPIYVGCGTWIGAKSIILGGVNIGEGCIIAAGSVVTQNVPPNCLVAGVPARIKRQLPL